MNDFVSRVLSLYLGLPDVAARRPSRHDRQLAITLFQRGISLEQIEAAMLLAHLRRAARSTALPPIRSLHYFSPAIDEIVREPFSPSWLHYLRLKRAATSQAMRYLRQPLRRTSRSKILRIYVIANT